MNRSRRPIAIGAFLPLRRQPPSHCSSCGQTRPETAGSKFFLLIILIAVEKSPSATHLIKLGISTSTGHLDTHFGFLQFKQRLASPTAISTAYPNATSVKLCRRTSGACLGMSLLFKSSFFFSFSGSDITHSYSEAACSSHLLVLRGMASSLMYVLRRCNNSDQST